MPYHWHSVTLDKSKCKGCTNCIKQCPTQAIRVQSGKAKIIKERCIDCGNCIRMCPYRAKKAVTDNITDLLKYKYTVALPAPAFLGQFSKAGSVDSVLSALKLLGFDHVFEVARGASIITEKTKQLMENNELEKPAISSACPAVVRLIAVRFPNLIGNLVPLAAPVEVAAQLARQGAMERTKLAAHEIGVFFISPCPAKATSVHSPIVLEKSGLDGAISANDIFTLLAHKISYQNTVQKLSKASPEGMLWANVGGETGALGVESSIAVDGIDNCLRTFDDLENGRLRDITYIEALACTGGCVGGALMVENSFVAKSRLKKLAKTLSNPVKDDISGINLNWDNAPAYRPVMNLDYDLRAAMQKAQHMERIYEGLPQLDCGSCGAPSCRALAEDIVRGFAKETDCVFKLREKVRALTKQMLDLEEL